MSLILASNLNIITDYIQRNLLTSDFKNTNLYNNELKGKRYHYVLQEGASLNLADFKSSGTNQFETWNPVNLVYKGTPFDENGFNNNIEIETTLIGNITVRQVSTALSSNNYDRLEVQLTSINSSIIEKYLGTYYWISTYRYYQNTTSDVFKLQNILLI